MDRVSRVYVRIAEGKMGKASARFITGRGQTMTEYALLLSAVAAIVYSGYKSMGTSITSVLTRVDGNL